MKVLHVETGRYLYGGARQVAYLLESLPGKGVECVLACSPGAAIGAQAQKIGLPIHELRCGGDLDLLYVRRLRRVIRQEQPHLVHLHSRRGAEVLGVMAARAERMPAVLSRRVDNPEPGWWARRKYARCARVIAISQGIAEVLFAEGVARGHVTVIRSALDPAPWQAPASRAELRDTFKLPPERLCVGVVAQLIERKGHRVLFEALSRLPHGERPSVICFGQGDLLDPLERETYSRGLSDLVTFAGFRDDLPRWMGALDLLVHPARLEGLGVSLLQAAAGGVPVIASRAGGMPEAVQDGVTGRLVPPGDAAALAEVLLELCRDEPQRRTLGAAGRARIEAEFSVDVMASAHLRLYGDVLSEPSSR